MQRTSVWGGGGHGVSRSGGELSLVSLDEALDALEVAAGIGHVAWIEAHHADSVAARGCGCLRAAVLEFALGAQVGEELGLRLVLAVCNVMPVDPAKVRSAPGAGGAVSSAASAASAAAAAKAAAKAAKAAAKGVGALLPMALTGLEPDATMRSHQRVRGETQRQRVVSGR
jgi:hypothetical protein